MRVKIYCNDVFVAECYSVDECVKLINDCSDCDKVVFETNDAEALKLILYKLFGKPRKVIE